MRALEKVVLRSVAEQDGLEESLWEVYVLAGTCRFVFSLSRYPFNPLQPSGLTTTFSFQIVAPRVESCVLSTGHAVGPERVHHGVAVGRQPEAFLFQPNVAQTFFMLAN